MTTINEAILSKSLKHSIHIERYKRGLTNGYIDDLNKLNADINSEINALNLENTSKNFEKLKRLSRQQNSIKKVIKNLIENNIQTDMFSQMNEFANIESAFAQSMLDSAIGVSLGTPILSSIELEKMYSNALIEGDLVKGFFSKQTETVTNDILRNIRLGISDGEGTIEITNRISKLLKNKSKREIETIVHTTVQKVSNDTLVETYKRNTDVVEYLQHISTFDKRTTPVCMSRSQLMWRADTLEPKGHGKPFIAPPLHRRCRSVMIPIVKPFEGLPKRIKERVPEAKKASIDGTIPASTSFDAFLKKQSVATQNEMLGVQKAKMFREGRLSTRDLVNDSGETLTLEQLKKPVSD